MGIRSLAGFGWHLPPRVVRAGLVDGSYFDVMGLRSVPGRQARCPPEYGAAGPILMGRVFDASGSYETVLLGLAVVSLGAAVLMRTLPKYEVKTKGLSAEA